MISAFLNEQPELIDEFTKRYPGIAIYVMDILSRNEAIQVTRKLSIDGIIRMIQEEARMTILNKFSFIGENASLETTLYITSLVEKVGKEKNYLANEERKLIYEIYEDFKKSKKKKFKFFDALPTEGRLSISVYLLNNDLVSFLVFILLTPKDIRFSILDSLPKNDLKKALSLLPQNVLLEYATYSNLPIQEIAEHIEDTALKDTLYRYKPKKDKIIESYKKAVKIIKENANQRNKLISGLYETLKNLDAEERSIVVEKLIWDRLLDKDTLIATQQLFEKI
jgi:hypothetical protein